MYENIRFSKQNMAVVGSYFYMFNESRNILVVKVDDGDSAFEYPINVILGGAVKSTQYDGYYFWTLQDSGTGVILKKWLLDNYLCKFVDSFEYLDGHNGTTYQSSSFGVEHYSTELSNALNSHTKYIRIDEYYDTVVSSGTIIHLGPNSEGEREEVTAVNVILGVIKLSSKTSNLYAKNDAISITRSFFLFNDFSWTSSAKGSLIRFDAYTGDYMSSTADIEYKNVTAAEFYRFENILQDYPSANALVYIKNTNAKLRNMSDLVDLYNATSMNDDFTGSDGFAPDASKWDIEYGDPTIQNNKLFMECIAGTKDQILSKYDLIGDFDVQVSGSMNYGLSTLPGASTFTHDMEINYSSSGGVNYKVGQIYVETAVPTDNLEVEYTMDSVSGTLLLDTSGKGHTGTMTNGPYTTAGKVGNSMYFDGSNDYIDLNTVSRPNLNNTSFSISFWIYPYIQSGWRAIFSWDGSVSDRPPSIYIRDITATDGFIHPTFGDGAGGQFSRYMSFFNNGGNNWYHIVWVLDIENQRDYIYRNGVQMYSEVQTGVATRQPIYFIGKGFNGRLDQVRFYKKALNELEVAGLYKEAVGSEVAFNDPGFNYYTSTDGIIDNLEPVVSGTSYLLRTVKTGSALNMYYKEITASGVVDPIWSLLSSLTSYVVDCKVGLGLSAFNSTCSGSEFDNFEFTKGTAVFPLDDIPFYGIINMDNVRSDQSTIIPIHDISIHGDTMYRLQSEGTYYGSNNSWSTYNYQTSTIRPFIDFITIGVDPVILPANGKNVSVVTGLVLDQYGNGIINRPVTFTDDNAVGYITTTTVNTDRFYGTGRVTTVYKAGLDVTQVVIEATATQYD